MATGFQFGKYTLSHAGIFVHDLNMMVEFYTEKLGFLITDRGSAKGAEVVFLSRNPTDHHQMALVTGRKTAIAERMVQQISFRVESLEVLTKLYPIVTSVAAVADLQPVFHGVSFSLYFRDPEGNRLEFFADTDWYVAQPCLQSLDLTLPPDEIYAEKKAYAESQPSFQPIQAWQADFERKLGNL